MDQGHELTEFRIVDVHAHCAETEDSLFAAGGRGAVEESEEAFLNF